MGFKTELVTGYAFSVGWSFLDLKVFYLFLLFSFSFAICLRRARTASFRYFIYYLMFVVFLGLLWQNSCSLYVVLVSVCEG